ncbi:hypothetical protein ACJJTC_019096 [Scirpophaga incertulas]
MSPKKNTKELQWGCCEVGLQDKIYMQCTECLKAYHNGCIYASGNSNDTQPSKAKWLYPLCTDKSGNNDNTPVRYNPNITVRPGRKPTPISPNITCEQPMTRHWYHTSYLGMTFVKSGHIYMRKTDDSEYKLFKNLATIDNLP